MLPGKHPTRNMAIHTCTADNLNEMLAHSVIIMSQSLTSVPIFCISEMKRNTRPLNKEQITSNCLPSTSICPCVYSRVLDVRTHLSKTAPQHLFSSDWRCLSHFSNHVGGASKLHACAFFDRRIPVSTSVKQRQHHVC